MYELVLEYGVMYESIRRCVNFRSMNTFSTDVGRSIMLIESVDAGAVDLTMSVCIAVIVGSSLILLALAKHLKFFGNIILIFGGLKRCYRVGNIATMTVVLLPLVFVH